MTRGGYHPFQHLGPPVRRPGGFFPGRPQTPPHPLLSIGSPISATRPDFCLAERPAGLRR